MCGILGWLSGRGNMDAVRFGTALDLLAHRGPDDRGVLKAPGVLLGHRRLSILDLSAAGHQPMIEPRSDAAIVFNGEIYNYVELRPELEARGHRLVGQSDTEVLLHALAEWGEEALPRLNGMWAFAFWAPAQRRLLLARDRFGVKPLYYRHEPDGFAFASEPKSLLALFPEHRAVNEGALLDFLANNQLYSRGESFYRGIHVLPPAHYIVYEPDTATARIARYWDYPTEVVEGRSPAEAAEQFDELFSSAVRLRLRSDVPVGLTLSGGLDSTGVLAAARSSWEQPLQCFTSVYGEGEASELRWAKVASQAAGAPLTPVGAPEADWLAVLRKVAWHMDGPGYSPAVYPLWRLMQQARAANVPVLLEGQGADEALGGYLQYAVLELIAAVSGGYGRRPGMGELLQRLRCLGGTFSLPWAAAWLARELWPGLLRSHRQRAGFQSLLRRDIAVPEVPPRPAVPGDPVRRRLIEDHEHAILPGLLHYGDAISMAHSIETRHPFMDYRLVEWMFRLPTGMRFIDGQTKWVLREYLRRHDQQAIADRPDKKGYPTPVGDWMARDDGREIEHLLVERRGLLQDWCDPEKIRRLIQQNRKGAMSADHHLYKLLSTQLWLDECIEPGPVPAAPEALAVGG